MERVVRQTGSSFLQSGSIVCRDPMAVIDPEAAVQPGLRLPDVCRTLNASIPVTIVHRPDGAVDLYPSFIAAGVVPLHIESLPPAIAGYPDAWFTLAKNYSSTQRS